MRGGGCFRENVPVELETRDLREERSMSQSAKIEKPDPFEKNLARLDAIVEELEDTDLSLDKALVLYEEGMKLSEFCHKQLEEAEGRVEILVKKAGGKMVAEPFETEDAGASK
jgi:exodeoxyribonuclease VII small subunit